jgi:hypothetical protein
MKTNNLQKVGLATSETVGNRQKESGQTQNPEPVTTNQQSQPYMLDQKVK